MREAAGRQRGTVGGREGVGGRDGRWEWGWSEGGQGWREWERRQGGRTVGAGRGWSPRRRAPPPRPECQTAGGTADTAGHHGPAASGTSGRRAPFPSGNPLC